MSDLTEQHCVPCEGGVEPLEGEALKPLLAQVSHWILATDEKSIFREFKFQNFVDAIVFITDIAHVAEEEQHHPDIHLHDYKFVVVTLSTNAIHGLSENDFILAAKINEVKSESE